MTYSPNLPHVRHSGLYKDGILNRNMAGQDDIWQQGPNEAPQ